MSTPEEVRKEYVGVDSEASREEAEGGTRRRERFRLTPAVVFCGTSVFAAAALALVRFGGRPFVPLSLLAAALIAVTLWADERGRFSRERRPRSSAALRRRRAPRASRRNLRIVEWVVLFVLLGANLLMVALAVA